jgi:hypothetical protein
VIVKQKIKKRSVYHYSPSPFGHVARLGGTKRRIRARNPLRKRAVTGVVLPVRGVVLSTVLILVLVPTVVVEEEEGTL